MLQNGRNHEKKLMAQPGLEPRTSHARTAAP